MHESTEPDRRAALVGGVALLVLTVMAIAASVLLDREPGRPGRLLVAALFCIIALLDVVVGWALWKVCRNSGLAMASFTTRGGYALLLLWATWALLGADGSTARFSERWDVALIVFGLHLALTAAALHPVALWWVWSATGLAGAGYLLDAAGAPEGPLMPFMFLELVLLGWLLSIGIRRPTPVVQVK